MQEFIPFLALFGAGVIILFGVGALFARFYRQVEQGKALIINTSRAEPSVTFTGKLVLPVVNRAEIMDLSVKTIQIDRRGKEGLICNDNIRADINVTFFVRVNKTHEDVLKVAQAIGCVRASDQGTVEGLFEAKFAEALKTVGKRMNFEDLYKERDHFKDAIIEVIGKDLNGFVMDDCAIDYLEQTPIESLDQNNIMDAEGIRKITDLTVTQNLKTNELRQKERMETGSQNLAGDEAIFRFEQKRSEAEARKNKEVSIAQSREQNEAQRIANEEAKLTLLAHEKNSEETLVAQQARERAVLVAMKNKEREIAVEVERVERARQMEVTTREADVVAQQITRQAEIERQKREIAEVVRGRIAVDKTVAEEEERIKDVRVLAEANRQRESLKIGAEGEAAQMTTRQVKAAEAAEEVAKAQARQRLVLAEADLEVADKHSRAKVRLAEGAQAEASAAGLAAARVREADAKALELTGAAEASAIRAKMSAEAAGIGEKAEAMKALDGVSRQHEEFRLQLEQQKVVALESIRAKRDVAGVQAEVLRAAFEHAKINIVGGDGAFFERFIRAVTVGQSIDGAVDQSEVLKNLMSQLGSVSGDDAPKG